MNFLRDPTWGGVSAIVAIFGLLLYIWAERRKIFPRRRKITSALPSASGTASGNSSAKKGPQSNSQSWAYYLEGFLPTIYLSPFAGFLMWLMLFIQTLGWPSEKFGLDGFWILAMAAIVIPPSMYSLFFFLYIAEIFKKIFGREADPSAVGTSDLVFIVVLHVTGLTIACVALCILCWLVPSTWEALILNIRSELRQFS
jgi:hypothetical protein